MNPRAAQCPPQRKRRTPCPPATRARTRLPPPQRTTSQSPDTHHCRPAGTQPRSCVRLQLESTIHPTTPTTPPNPPRSAPAHDRRRKRPRKDPQHPDNRRSPRTATPPPKTASRRLPVFLFHSRQSPPRDAPKPAASAEPKTLPESDPIRRKQLELTMWMESTANKPCWRFPQCR